jgi:cytochrome c-type biogenesis protein CcmH/NrfF
MQKWKASFLIVLLATVGLAQNASQWDSDAVNRVARRLNCTCGCKTNMACQMPPQPCPICKMNKEKIYQMQSAGMSDDAIVAAFVKQDGPDIAVVPPGIMGMVGPYAALLLGLGLVVLVIRRYKHFKPAAATSEVDSALLQKIEQDLANLDG